MIQMFDLWFLLNELETEWNETKLNVGTMDEEETNEATAAPSPPARRKENT